MYPTHRLLWLLALPALLSLGLLIEVTWWPALVGLDAAIVLLVLFDALRGLPARSVLTITADIPGIWSLARQMPMRFEIANADRRGWTVLVHPDLPRVLVCEEEPVRTTLAARSRVEVRFHARARQRGSFPLRGLHLAVTSRLGFWVTRHLLGTETGVHVYPDLKQLGQYALLARTNRLSLIGVRASRRIGGDTEFERLRDWHSDDEVNRIDWKATARRAQLTVRDFQMNQSQGLMLMIDAGRMMASRTKGPDGVEVSMLDLAIDAALMLAYVALAKNDRVGLLAYADGIKRWLPIEGGSRQMKRLIHALHDLEPSLVESRHDEAFLYLGRKERKRSLVTVFTNILDDVSADLVSRHCANLVGRHLPLVVLLQDPDVHEPLREAPADRDAFWRSGAAALLVGWRRDLLERLTLAGCLVIDVPGHRLTPDAVNQYLRVKALHLL